MNTIGLVVFAMHRSGSSMLTALLGAAGVFLGSPRYLQYADSDNADGYWEHDLLRRANEALFNWNGHDWFDTFDWQDRKLTSERASAFAEQARLVATDLEQKQLWGVKDPRLCFTWPYWQPFLSPATALICVRHPLQVADSLRRRNRFPMEFGLLLWEDYVNRALRASQNMKRSVVLDEDLLTRPKETLIQTFDEMGIEPPSGLNALASNTVVRPELRRASAQEYGELSPTQARLWQALSNRQCPPPARLDSGASALVARNLPLIILRQQSRRVLHRLHQLEQAVQNLNIPDKE